MIYSRCRLLRFFLVIILVCSTSLIGCEVPVKETKEIIKIETNEITATPLTTTQANDFPAYKPISYEKLVKPYKVNSDLSNIANIDKCTSFTSKEKELLAKNGFLVVPTNREQLFYVYDTTAYTGQSLFITTDSVLQVYNVLYNCTLRKIEGERLSGSLIQLTDSMLKKSIEQYKSIQNPTVKQSALKNIAYFAVAQKALGKEVPSQIPDEANQMLINEYAQITAQTGIKNSPIFGVNLDYSQFKPRGHYTINDELKRYFTAMTWYGQAPFTFFNDGEQKVLNIDNIVRAMLITNSLYQSSGDAKDIDLWEKIYRVTCFYVGETDDLNVYNCKTLLTKVYGGQIDIDRLTDQDKIQNLTNEARNLPNPKIQANLSAANISTGKQFRFMGQRYIPDSEVLQGLTDSKERPIPKGLDVMGVLGSERALEHLSNIYQEDKKWDKYMTKFNQLKDSFSKLSQNTWNQNMYYGWLWTLKSLLTPFGEGYPSFMTNSAWEDKSLSTAQGSWAELRHNTILYGKGSSAECGDGGDPPKGYVEPNVELYQRLLWLTQYTEYILKSEGVLTESIKSPIGDFENLLKSLINDSILELKNQELSNADYWRIVFYGGQIERLTLRFAGEGTSWSDAIKSEIDRNMANIADVHTFVNTYLEAGVGLADRIYVVVPIGGKLYLTSGAVFSYYEFTSNTRLTDAEWQKMLKSNKQPSQPAWVSNFKVSDKVEK